MHAPGERRTASRSPAAPTLLNPPRYRLRIRPGLAAQPRGGPGQRLVRFALASALEDSGHLGQQVGTAGRERPELGHGRGFLVAGELTPPGAVPSLTGELCYQDPVSFRALIDHMFQYNT